MEEKILSADELLKSQQDLAQGVPSFGNKLVEPRGIEQEAQDLEQRLKDLRSTLDEPRVSQRSQLSEALWDMGKDLAKVTKPCNRHWGVMGHTVDDGLHLYPEEALFLLESNAIEVKLNDVAMSIQQSYEVMLAKDCSLDEYRVYSHLTRQGYKVVRHQGDLSVTVYEDSNIQPDNGRRKNRKAPTRKDLEEIIALKAPKDFDEVVLESADTTSKQVSGVSESQSFGQVQQGNGRRKKRKALQIPDLPDFITLKTPKIVEEVVLETADIPTNYLSGVSESRSFEQVEEINLGSDDDDDIEILNGAQLNRDKALAMMPNLFGKTEATLETPKTELLPFRVWPKKSSYKVTISRPTELGDVDNLGNNDTVAETLSVSVSETGERHVQQVNNVSLRQNRRFYNPIVRTKGKKSKGQKVKNSQTYAQKWGRFCPNPQSELFVPVMPEESNDGPTIGSKGSTPLGQNDVMTVVPEVITLSDDEGDSKPSDILVEGPLKTLWNVGNSTPLLKPSQAKSTKAIFSAITLKSPNGTDTRQKLVKGTQFKISFDVYAPNVHFKKSAPRLPNFRVVITKYDTNVPTEQDLAATMAGICDKVPLMFGIVSQSDIALFSLNPVSLPTYVTMG